VRSTPHTPTRDGALPVRLVETCRAPDAWYSPRVAYLTIDVHQRLLVARRVGIADAPSVTSMLRWVSDALHASRHPLALVYDAGTSAGGLPDAAARRAGGEWLARNQRLLRERCVGIDFAFASPVSRGALTAVFWIAQPVVPWAIHASVELAVESALTRLGDARFDAADVLRELARHG